MPRDRRSAPGTPDLRRAVTRLEEGQAGIKADFVAGFEKIAGTLALIQADVRLGNIERGHLGNRLAELELQVQETRDQVARSEGTHAAAAAEGAARGAVQGVAAAAPKRFLATWKGWVITVGAAIAGAAAAVQGLPSIVRFFAGLFDFLGKLK